MKILHCADLHFNNSTLLPEIVKCADFMAKAAVTHRPDLVAVAGDVFDEKIPLGSKAVVEAISLVSRLGDTAPVVIVKGTYSHDHDSLHVFGKLKTRFPVYVSEKVEQVALTPDGFYPLGSLPDNLSVTAVISCLPSVSKAGLMPSAGAVDADIHAVNMEAAELLRDVFAGWGLVNADARRRGIPAVIVGHGSLMGSTTSTGQQMSGRDLEFGSGDLSLAKADAVCLGHIHKAQFQKNIFYSGSITRLNFGEEEDKGFYFHEIEDGKLASSFIKTPARRLITLDISSMSDLGNMQDDLMEAHVRIRYAIGEENLHRMDDERIRKLLADRGAAEVVIRKTVVPANRVRAAGISQAKSLDEKIRRWAEAAGVTLPDGVFAKAVLLARDTEEILSMAGGPDKESQVFENRPPIKESEEACDLFMQN